MRDALAAVAVVAAGVVVGPALARAEGGASQRPARDGEEFRSSSAGLAVLAERGAEVAGWALAREVYADAALRPELLEESSARVLVGEAPSGDLQPAARDLADERALVQGDDGASRALLAAIASQLRVGTLLVVESSPSGSPSARLFFAGSQSFDAARYAPDVEPSARGAATEVTASTDAGINAESGLVYHWSTTVRSLARTMVLPIAIHAPSLATSPVAPAKVRAEGRPFYASPWFWAAAGAAAFGVTAVWFATRGNSGSTIHLDLQVPK